MYRLHSEFDGILKALDSGGYAAVPNDPANVDWQEYQAWLAAGNTPEPAE